MQPLQAQIDWPTGRMSAGEKKIRRASDMVELYYDRTAAEAAADQDDPIIYEYTTIELPETTEHVLYGTTTIYPGTIGKEYFMTKGHYHQVRGTGEVYFCFGGEGRLIMATEEGDTSVLEMHKGSVSYVPPGWAHRVCNTGSEPLMFFAAFPGHAGHDYGSIAESGLPVRVEERNGQPVVITKS